MRKKQIFVLLMVFAFLSVSSIPMILFAKGEKPSVESPFGRRSADGEYLGIDGTSRYETLTLEGMPIDTGNTWTVAVINDYYGGSYLQDFECVLEGDYANIWIGINDTDVYEGGFSDYYDDGGTIADVSDDTWYFAYPWSSIGIDAVAADAPDPDEDGYYLPPNYYDWITMADLEFVIEEFDRVNGIHDMVTSKFGMYANRPGPFIEDPDYKIQVLIFNMRDGLFYDPINAGWFIMGYFWSQASNVNDANIFHMDTYQWWRRLGNPTETWFGLSPLPMQYEGTFAHEFQHLVHYDIDPNELSWVNEGCSTLAEWLCGYGFSAGHISEYLLYWWDTSLVIWQGELSNYGAVFLWTFYMYQHYGGDSLIWDLVHHLDNGIAAWNDLLSMDGYCYGDGKLFDDIFQEWAMANYLDGDGIYGYPILQLPSADTGWYSIPYTLWMWEDLYPGSFDTQVDKYPHSGYNYPYGSSIPYVVNYVEFYKKGGSFLNVEFDGDDFCGVPAYNGDWKWHSDGAAWAWFRMHQTFEIPETGATLNFANWFQIEADWDYAYVEVNDNGHWYTLPGLRTVDDVGFNYGTYNLNCPDDLEPTTYYDAGEWHAFTGSSGGWYQETMDLSFFAGRSIELYFTYWTDPYTIEAGMYIDDISIPELAVPFFDDVEDGLDGWTVDAGWYRNDVVIPNDFKVNFIEFMTYSGKNGMPAGTYANLVSMELNPVTQEGQESLFVVDVDNIVESFAVMIVANQPGIEHTFGTFSSFNAHVIGIGKSRHS